MREYILLLPILFIFHDMEEIIGFGNFFKKNTYLFEQYPQITKAYRMFSTEGMAIGVYEEFIPFFGVSLLTYYFPNKILNAIWFALILSLTVHFVIHIFLCISIRKFIPSLITGLICLPVCVTIIIKCIPFLQFDLLTSVFLVKTVVLMRLNLTWMKLSWKMLNLKFAHWIMNQYNKKHLTA